MDRLQKQMRSENPISHRQCQFFLRKNRRGQRSQRFFRAIPQVSFKVDLPVPPLSEPVEPARESEPVSFPSFMELQPVAPFPEASAPEPSHSAVIPETPPAPEPVSTEHHEIPITLFQVTEAPPLSQRQVMHHRHLPPQRIHCLVGALAKSRFSHIVRLKRNETGTRRRGRLQSFRRLRYRWLRNRLKWSPSCRVAVDGNRLPRRRLLLLKRWLPSWKKLFLRKIRDRNGFGRVNRSPL